MRSVRPSYGGDDGACACAILIQDYHPNKIIVKKSVAGQLKRIRKTHPKTHTNGTKSEAISIYPQTTHTHAHRKDNARARK